MSDQSLRRHVEDVRKKRDYTTGFSGGTDDYDSDECIQMHDSEHELREGMNLRLRLKNASENNLSCIRSPLSPENASSTRIPLPEFRPSDGRSFTISFVNLGCIQARGKFSHDFLNVPTTFTRLSHDFSKSLNAPLLI